MIKAVRYHDFSAGHRVVNHESKCQHLHGHNYRVHFRTSPEDGEALDSLGRVLDFGVIKSLLCEWLEDHWDHKFLIWEDDPYLPELVKFFPDSLVVVPFNPTAENMAIYLVEVIGPVLLEGTGTVLQEVEIEETRKCSVIYERSK